MLRRATEVRSPDGRAWTVGIRWLPRRPKWLGWGFGRERHRRGDSSAWWYVLDVPDFGDELGWFFVILGVVIAVALLWFVVFPVLVFILDLLLLVLLAAGAIALRVLFRRPWIVQAVSDDETLSWAVVGWRKSNERVNAVVARLKRGLPLDDLPAPV
jgi:hypothetical protein